MMQYEFLKQFPKRMKHVGRYLQIFANSSQKTIWKQFGFVKLDEQVNVIFAVMLYIMEQSLRENHCTIDDIGAYLDNLNMGYFEIAYNENNHLKITTAGAKVLFGQEKAMLVVIKREEKETKSKGKKKEEKPLFKVPVSVPMGEENPELFEELRALRKRLADQQAIPAYIVLSDKTLHQLAIQRPTTLEEFGMVSGIGEYKKEKYGKDFVELINTFIK